MQDELKSRRQLQALQRYRALQQERAELVHARARHSLHQAKSVLQREHGDYLKTIQHYTDELKVGASLNPALQQPRLAAMMQASRELDARQQQFEQKQLDCQLALSHLVQTKANVDVVVNARQHLDAQIAAQYQHQELADIFDSQRRKGAYHDS